MTGCQSLYDILLKDHLIVARSTGWIYTISAILSRFDTVAELTKDNHYLAVVACSVYAFGLVTSCISLGLISIVRICCLVNIQFMEENIGETFLRMILSGITFSGGLIFCVVQGPLF